MKSVTRRDVLRAGGALAAVTGAGVLGGQAYAAQGGREGALPFAHGVASGDPLPDGVLLWTRVTPTPESVPGSGVGPDVTVSWEMALDERFTEIVAGGAARTGPGRDHTVKIDVAGLHPATSYWYRFRYGSAVSTVGRTRTAPADGSAVDRLRLGVVSCANWQAGYFAAYRHLAQRDDLDLVVHLGDYLYEYGPGDDAAADAVLRPHDPPLEIITLEHYRRRHAQYKTDPDLQALHARVPFAVTWDDHESANNAWSGGAENHTEQEEGTWASRRAASQQAYAEWMPVRYEPGGRLYRRLTFGTLAELSMLDLRSYRSEQPAHPFDPGIADPDRTITGAEQLDWLTSGLATARVQWKLVGNSVMISPVRFPSTLSTEELRALSRLTGPVTGVPINVDQWDGYTADRLELFAALRDNGVRDTVFLTGDIHTCWAAELPSDPLTYPLNRASVGTELVCTSVTSDNIDDILGVPPRTASLALEAAIRVANPHIKHVELDSHGYSVVEVTPGAVRMDSFVLTDRKDPGSGVRRAASFRVDAGTQHVVRVWEDR
ncbi:alkaline phosphatase D [Saccharomonospora amisosensis]|uniref:Alkaline phosphatase D n=1 Tax=Saccharomonospora amisosensis TaxID=1128677 RepID=A0A7X5UNN3_9PSEU|nr:alkaline phosphatase D family protein [Saccharomonospora amisosensis]NIJ11342.1 alkaline phosphatase D [Saccharomonospora amisosensis]